MSKRLPGQGDFPALRITNYELTLFLPEALFGALGEGVFG